MEEDICFAVMLSLVSRDPFLKYDKAVVGSPVLELSSVHLGVLRGKNRHRFTPF